MRQDKLGDLCVEEEYTLNHNRMTTPPREHILEDSETFIFNMKNVNVKGRHRRGNGAFWLRAQV